MFFHLFLRKNVENAPKFGTFGFFLKIWFKKQKTKKSERPTQIFKNSTWGQHNFFFFFVLWEDMGQGVTFIGSVWVYRMYSVQKACSFDTIMFYSSIYLEAYFALSKNTVCALLIASRYCVLPWETTKVASWSVLDLQCINANMCTIFLSLQKNSNIYRTKNVISMWLLFPKKTMVTLLP